MESLEFKVLANDRERFNRQKASNLRVFFEKKTKSRTKGAKIIPQTLLQ